MWNRKKVPSDAGRGRRSFRSGVWRWTKRIALGTAGLVVVLTVSGAVYEALGKRSAARDFPPPGKLVDIGGRRIHIDCRGSGSPTVVFEAGSDTYGSTSWAKVHDRIAQTTRACAYDRAGIMWSDPLTGAQNGDRVAEDLHKALAAAGEKGPFVLAAHSLGGVYAMIYNRKYPDQVAGLVLVDPGHPDQEKQMARFQGMKELSETFDTLQSGFAALAWTGLPRLASSAIVTPNVPERTLAQSNAYYSMSLKGMLAGMKGIGRTMAQATDARNFGDRPVIVVSRDDFLDAATIDAMGMSKADGERFNADWRRFRVEEASWSTRGENRVISNSGHFIQFDQPDAVVKAIEDVLSTVRKGPAPASPAPPGS